MIKRTLLPQELFQTIGSTLGTALTKNQRHERLRVAKMAIEMQVELAPDLETIEMPSNQQKIMDQKQPVNLFKIKVNAR